MLSYLDISEEAILEYMENHLVLAKAPDAGMQLKCKQCLTSAIDCADS